MSMCMKTDGEHVDFGRAVVARHEGVTDDELEAVLAEEYEELVRIAYLIVGTGSEARDVVQTALERAWRARASLRDAARTRAWLRTIVTREAIRSKTTWWRRLTEAWPAAVDVRDRSTDSHVLLDLERAFHALPVPQRAVIVLHHYAGYGIDEVAAMVGAPRGTVRSRLRLGLERLRRELDR